MHRIYRWPRVLCPATLPLEHSILLATQDCKEDHTPSSPPLSWRALLSLGGSGGGGWVCEPASIFLASYLVLLIGGAVSPYHPNAAALYGFNDLNVVVDKRLIIL